MRKVILIVVVLSIAGAAGHLLFGAGEIAFKDVARQSRQFIGWYQTIQLTPEQEAIKKSALEKLPAPCCGDETAYTCCCKCNVSRTIWGLSHHMIAKQGASAEKVREKVAEWIRFVNPNGYSGRACYTGGCARPFAKDGCGGMKADHLVF